MLGVDVSERVIRQQAHALRAWGVGWIGRYTHTLTQEEIRFVTEAGLMLLTIFENRPLDPAYFTAFRGAQDGWIASGRARHFGQPDGTVIHATVDYDATVKDIPAIAAYVEAFAHAVVPYRAGIYGGYPVIAQITGPLVASRWQTLAWSNGDVAADADVYQIVNGVHVAGVTADLDWARTTAGLWHPPGVVTPPAPVA